MFRRAGGDGRVSDATADPLRRLPARAVVAGVQHPQWVRKRPAELQPKRRITYYERQAIFELDFFGTLQRLRASRQSVFHEDECAYWIQTPTRVSATHASSTT